MTAGTTLIGKGLHTCWKAGAFAGPSTGRAREAWGRWEACGGAWGGAWGRGVRWLMDLGGPADSIFYHFV